MGLMGIAIVVMAACLAQADCAPQPEQTLKSLLEITWSRGPNLPQGFQDSNGGVVGGWLVTTCGFCAGHNNDKKPGRFCVAFSKKTWAINLCPREGGLA